MFLKKIDLKKEFIKLNYGEYGEEFSVELNDENEENYKEWRVQLPGPKDSPYEDGIFELRIKFDYLGRSYPLYPPKVEFITKIYHPFVQTSTGRTSFSFLYENWNIDFSVYDILKKIQNELKNPNMGNPVYEIEILRQYKESRKDFEKTAREWTNKYAKY